MAPALQVLSGDEIRISLRCECIVVTVRLHWKRRPRFVLETSYCENGIEGPREIRSVDVTNGT
jgi:hypothetical protein